MNLVDLPDVPLLLILRQLSERDLSAASQTCRKLRALCQLNQLWRHWMPFADLPVTQARAMVQHGQYAAIKTDLPPLSGVGFRGTSVSVVEGIVYLTERGKRATQIALTALAFGENDLGHAAGFVAPHCLATVTRDEECRRIVLFQCEGAIDSWKAFKRVIWPFKEFSWISVSSNLETLFIAGIDAEQTVVQVHKKGVLHEFAYPLVEEDSGFSYMMSRNGQRFLIERKLCCWGVDRFIPLWDQPLLGQRFALNRDGSCVVAAEGMQVSVYDCNRNLLFRKDLQQNLKWVMVAFNLVVVLGEAKIFYLLPSGRIVHQEEGAYSMATTCDTGRSLAMRKGDGSTTLFDLPISFS